MTTYSGVVNCYCGQQHKVEGVRKNFTEFMIGMHSFMVRSVECARCLKIEFQNSKNFSDKSCYIGQYICRDCQPIVLQNHIDQFDRVTLGTNQIIEKLDECLVRLGKLEKKPTSVSENTFL